MKHSWLVVLALVVHGPVYEALTRALPGLEHVGAHLILLSMTFAVVSIGCAGWRGFLGRTGKEDPS